MPSRKVLAMLSVAGVVGFISALVVLSMYSGIDNYTPTTDDGATIYDEACARCHGAGGKGGDGPRLAGYEEGLEEIIKQVRGGEGKMPRFPNIQGRALENLARHVERLP